MIRTRRLKRDYEKLRQELGASEVVRVEAVSGDPPSHYRAVFRLNGLVWDETINRAKPITEHVVDIYLPPDYPKHAPRCTMRTPIWHPNIGDYVCIGDFWSAGVTLVDIIAHIGDMIQYKSYNLRSPVNKAAAQWAQRHEKSFPVGTRGIRTPDSDEPAIAIDAPPPADEPEIRLGPIRERR